MTVVLVMASGLTSIQALASEIDSCLDDAQKMVHVIDQRENIESCFQLNIKKVSKNKCFALVRRSELAKKNSDLRETLNDLCFYQAADFSGPQQCLEAAQNFQLADNHDEAIFECYRLFQSRISQKQCLEISRKLIYPAKQAHLREHCENNY